MFQSSRKQQTVQFWFQYYVVLVWYGTELLLKVDQYLVICLMPVKQILKILILKFTQNSLKMWKSVRTAKNNNNYGYFTIILIVLI